MQSKTILITGATSGIGRHAALHLLARGHRVIATGRREELLRALEVEAADPRLTTLRLDVCDADSIADAVAEVDAQTDGYGVDVLVNNAGYAQGGAVLDVPLEAVRQQYETNVFGLLATTRAFSPRMFERGNGRIVNISSMAGRFTLPTTGVYNSTKYAVEALSDAMRVECKAFGIDVVLIEPGAIKTNFNDTLKSTVDSETPDTGRWSGAYRAFARVMDKTEPLAKGPKPVSEAISKAVEARSPKARYIAPVADMFTLWLILSLPTFVFDYIRRRLIGMHRPSLPE